MNKMINGELMKTQTFGVEIETYNLGKQRIVELMAQYFHDKYGIKMQHYYSGNTHANYVAIDHKGRRWNAEDDSSLSGRATAEVVSPILTYEDIEDLQNIVRLLRTNGAKSNADHGCGVHIHVGLGEHTPKSIRNLVNIMASHEELLKKAIGFSYDRNAYTQNINERFLRALNGAKPKTFDTLKSIHYNNLVGSDESHYHYSSARYYNLNVHAVWDKGTVEFRCFEFHRNMHAGELKAYIQLCLAMSKYAQLINYASFRRVSTNNEKCTMKNWLVNMGLVGDEYKTCRKMLLKRLSGDSAYRNGRPHSDTLDDLHLDTLGA